MLCQGSISLAVLTWMPLDKYWLKKKNNKNISRVVIVNESTWENISMCNAFRKIGNNVINKRLTGLRSSCCFGDDLLQVQWFEGISVYRLTSDVCCLIISMFTSLTKISIPCHEATSSLRRWSSLCNLSEICIWLSARYQILPNRILLFLFWPGKAQSTSIPVPHTNASQ